MRLAEYRLHEGEGEVHDNLRANDALLVKGMLAAPCRDDLGGFRAAFAAFPRLCSEENALGPGVGPGILSKHYAMCTESIC